MTIPAQKSSQIASQQLPRHPRNAGVPATSRLVDKPWLALIPRQSYDAAAAVMWVVLHWNPERT